MKFERVVKEPRRESPAGRKPASLGALLYIVAAVEFVLSMGVCAARYGPPSYSPVTDTISDLQAVKCGTFLGAYVCSPLHTLANLSVAILGMLIILGSLLIRTSLPGDRRRDLAIVLLVVAGLATFANAFTPEDVTLTGDTVTALIAFLGANFGLIQMGRTMSLEPRWRNYSLFSRALGTFGIVAFILDGLGLGRVIGMGTVEWLIVTPILIWASFIGLLIVRQ